MPTTRRKRPPPSRVGAGRENPVRWIVSRFFGENMIQTSAALAFTTLLSMVPLLTVVLSLAHLFPYADPLLLKLDALLKDTLLPPGAAATIVAGLVRFTDKARQLTWAGLAVLAVTAFMLLHTIERAFNHLWQVEPRPWLARLGLYALMMLVWPLLLGGIAVAVSFAVSSSLGWFGDLGLAEHWVLKGSSLFLLGLFFSFLYYAVPNAAVVRHRALLGGFFAALAFAGMQKVFEYYLVSSALLKSIYGAFAAFPVFLLWLHVSWGIVLLGGLLAATGSDRARR